MKKESFNLPCIILSNIPKLFCQIIILLLAASVSIHSQQLTSRPDRGLSGKGTQQVSEIDSVNLQNGGVSVSIPLASLPPIAGGKLSYTLNAFYNSKLWDTLRSEEQGTTSSPGCQPAYSTETVAYNSTGGGWQIGGGYQVFFRTAQEDYNYLPASSFECYGYEFYHMQGTFFKPMLRTPDGSEHEMRIEAYYDTYSSIGTRDHLKGYYKYSGTGPGISFSSPMRFYTVDGTYLSVIVNPSSYTVNWTVYMKDGTRIEKSADGQRTIDTNGNSILYGVNLTGGYSFAKDEQTGREIKWSSSTYNGQSATKVEYQTVGGSWQTVWVVWGTTTVQGKIYSRQDWNPQGGEFGGGDSCYSYAALQDTFSVVREIIMPATEQSIAPQKFTFAYNSDTTVQTTDNNINWGCAFPMPSETYTRTASVGLGELSEVVTPTGAVINYKYRQDGIHRYGVFGDGAADEILRDVITEKKITHDGTFDIWDYDIDFSPWAVYGEVTNPDGSTYRESFKPVNLQNSGSDGQGGLQIKAKQSDRIMTEKEWILLGGVLYAFGTNPGSQRVTYNPAVDTEYTTLLAENGTTRLKMSAKKFLYNYNGELIQTIEYDWFDPSTVTFTNNDPVYGKPTGIPSSATVLRVINNSYYNQAADASSSNAYHKRNVGTSTVILGALQETTVGDGTTVKSTSRFSFDGQSYGTAPIKGNLTQVSAWDDTNNQWLNSGSTYDTYGNVITQTNPKGNTTYIYYEDNTHVMPTKTIVDPQNGSGQQIATTTYDFYTGAVLTSTDINGNTSSVDYYNHLLQAVDPFGRPGTAYSPYVSIDGVNKRRTVKTFYEDAARKTRVESDLFNEGDALVKARESRDQMGRAVLSERNENGANSYTISSETVYKMPERVVLQSNPHRSSAFQTDGWTRATSDILGRSIEVATFSGTAQPPITGTNADWTGSMTTGYSANTTTVTDQAGKQRRSVVDALGRLTRVDEPNEAGQLDAGGVPAQPTNYSYDVLGNLLTVGQGTQTRTFVYDSLSRLKSAVNPESGTITYVYDNNGNLTTKTDARGVITNYVYDALNRVTQRSYAAPTNPANYEATPTVNYTYENTSVTSLKGILTKVTNGFSTTEYQVFDALGRVTQSRQTTDGTTYGEPMTYTYNLSGAMIEQKYPSGRVVKNVLDNNGDLSIVQSKKNQNSGYFNYAKNFTYNAAGAVTSMQLGNSRWESTQFNSRLQPTQIALGTVQNATDKLKLDFEYGTVQWNGSVLATENNGNVGKQTITVPTETRNSTTYDGFSATQYYTYDALNRIKIARENLTPQGQTGYQSWQQTFTYDRYGNRNFDEANTTTLPKNCGTSPNFTVCTADKKVLNPSISTSNNRIIQDQDGDSQNDYLFDTSGNTTKDAMNRTFIYDAENKQIEVKNSQDQTIGQYFYDGDGKRVKKYVPSTGETTIFIYDASGKLVAEYSTIVTSQQDTKVSYLTADHLGSPRINTDQNGLVTARHDYQPFGEEIQRASYGADTVRKQFTGYERDKETDLDFAQARMYANNLGRFTTSDPIYITDERLNDPQQINTYVYSRNNPVKYTDPSGLDIEVKGNEKDWAVEKIKEDVSFAKVIGVNDKGLLAISNGRGGFYDPNNKGDKAILNAMANSLKDDKDVGLFNAIIDTNNHAVLEATTNDNTVDIGGSVSPGNNAVDRNEVEMMDKVGKDKGGLSAAQIVKHEVMEAYGTAKTGKPIYDGTSNADSGPHYNNPYPGLEAFKEKLSSNKTVVDAKIIGGGGTYKITKTFDGKTVNNQRTGNITKVTFNPDKSRKR